MSGPPCPQVANIVLSQSTAQDICDCISSRTFWTGNTCQNAFQSMIYTTQTGGVGFNQTNLLTAQGMLDGVFSSYLADGYQLTVPNADGYNVFQEVLLDTCQKSPGLCDSALQQFCTNQPTGPYPNLACGTNCLDRDILAQNAGLLSFCGCWAPPPVETQVNNISNNQALSVLKQYPACDPICNRIENVKKGDGMGNSQTCPNQTVCVIDQTTINVAQSNLGPGQQISFSQICPCSNNGVCTCIIAGTNLVDTMNQSNLQVQINQVCGPDALCLQENDQGGIPIPVNCQTALAGWNSSSTSFWSSLSTTEWVFLIIGIIIFLIIMILLITTVVSSQNQRTKGSLVRQSQNRPVDLSQYEQT